MSNHNTPTADNLLDITITAGNQILDGRTPQDVMTSLTSEVGELAEEVNIAFSTRKSYKQPGPDGIIGEGVDVILCVLDLLHITHPQLTHQQLLAVAQTKLAKWVQKSNSLPT